MRVPHLSASRLKTFLQCTLKYHAQYERKIRQDAPHLRFGTLLHKVFERYDQEEGKDIYEIYDEEWTNGGVHDAGHYKDGKDIIQNFLDMNEGNNDVLMGLEIAFAIDLVNDHVYSVEDINFDDADERNAFFAELEDSPYPIIFGYIDKIKYDPDKDVLKIIDYKTSWVPLSYKEADDDEQLSMYDLVASYLFPEYKNIKEELHYVRHGEVVYTSRTEEERETFKDWVINMYYLILQEDDPKPTLNNYCGYCPIREECPAYTELIRETDVKFDPLEDKSYQELDEELVDVAQKAKILYARKQEIENIFKGDLKKNDNENLDLGEYERYLSPIKKTNYDVQTVIDHLPDDYEGVMSVTKGKVDKLVKDDDKLKKELDRTSYSYYQEPRLQRRKKKKEKKKKKGSKKK